MYKQNLGIGLGPMYTNLLINEDCRRVSTVYVGENGTESNFLMPVCWQIPKSRNLVLVQGSEEIKIKRNSTDKTFNLLRESITLEIIAYRKPKKKVIVISKNCVVFSHIRQTILVLHNTT